ncbi:NhaP-type Na+/H+ or K+/H+ antiporter [Amycolatopsis lexingtonensis]|uniref:NhaP-type Na+/H+ or K+/H+ antiporter n=1 Tax=Amycolatopsis lexingtonensis TaxID=218822 RepID=A0ABR9HRM3_9PSEU|nr:cation:proton antiporter [Amycolatopsis lexingtonensis]MBE1493573.1 NhaP-type Na+/H+ or K+/H+ antiporter [Amycolatopsis lexingtonensis]
MFIPALLVLSAAFLLRSLLAARLDRWNIAAPVLMVVCGAAAALTVAPDTVLEVFNTEIAQHVAELILAMLLFVDATEVRGGRLWGRSPGLVARVLLIAMPLSIALAVLLGAVLLPDLSWPLLLLIACIVIPSDFAAAERVVRDRNLPAPVRGVLNIESGYNDGLVSPVFLFALILARTDNQQNTAEDALATALPFAIKAVVMGAATGALIGLLLFLAAHAGWTSAHGRRVAVLTTPLLAYAATVAIDGNGFVASFVCGIAFRYVFRGSAASYIRKVPGRARDILTDPTAELQLLEEVTGLLTMGMWFVVGAISVLVVRFGLSWQVVVFCLAALTVLRIGPVVLSLLRTDLSGRDRFLIGALGPRGTTSIVFGLLALNGLATGEEDIVLTITVVCVLGSVVLHGIGSAPLANRLGRRRQP